MDYSEAPEKKYLFPISGHVTKLYNQIQSISHAMGKIKKVVSILLVPFTAVVWLFGWSLYWIGSNYIKSKPQKTGNGEHPL